jgi:small subunit ribosomal protein S4
MSKYCGPRLRIVRRLGEIKGFTRKSDNRPHYSITKKLTPFSYRLLEKQKVRFYYGIMEKQIVRYVKKRRKAKGQMGQVLIQTVESRLDNIVYRLGWAVTIPHARQIINHKNIWVNEKSVTAPSFHCAPYTSIKISQPPTSNLAKLPKSNSNLPAHLSINTANTIATVTGLALKDDIPMDV